MPNVRVAGEGEGAEADHQHYEQQTQLHNSVHAQRTALEEAKPPPSPRRPVRQRRRRQMPSYGIGEVLVRRMGWQDGAPLGLPGRQRGIAPAPARGYGCRPALPPAWETVPDPDQANMRFGIGYVGEAGGSAERAAKRRRREDRECGEDTFRIGTVFDAPPAQPASGRQGAFRLPSMQERYAILFAPAPQRPLER